MKKETLVPLLAIAFISEYATATLGMGYGTTPAPILVFGGYEPLTLAPVILFSLFFFLALSLQDSTTSLKILICEMNANRGSSASSSLEWLVS
ncbi:MAG: hypothetical protein ACFFER_02975 [Candidatus Thorarchaeota archaeon]